MDIRGSKKSSTKARPRSTSASVAADDRKSLAGAKLSKKDIDEAFRSIDEETEGAPQKKFRLLRRRKKMTRKKKIIIAIIVILLMAAAAYAIKLITSAGNMFQGNMLDVLGTNKLKEDDNNRTNILVFGTSEDNEGHSGALLADSIIVLSVNQETKDANMMSIPRDLWVDYSNPNCSVGSEGKINATYLCALEANNNDENQASLDFASVASKVAGLDVQYYARVNYSVVRDLVNSVGGIEVMIDSEDPRGILDRGMDKNCPDGPYTCHFVNYPNGIAQLDGEHALALSRARNAKGGYGLSQGNFDREKNQQKIIKALQDKALSAGTLTNPVKIMNLVDSLGNNIKSNMEAKELQSAIKIAQGVNSEKIVSLSLNKKDRPIVQTDNYMGQSIVRPIAGIKDYSQIHALFSEAIDSAKSSNEDNQPPPDTRERK